MSSDDASPPGDGSRDDASGSTGALGRFLTVRDTEGGDGRRKVDVHRGWIRRHWIVTSVVAAVLVMVTGFGAWAYHLNALLDNTEEVAVTIPDDLRPAENTGEDLNILVAGADNGAGSNIAEDVAAGQWTPGKHLSDTIMVLHIPANRQHAYLISVPRDSYVPLYDESGEQTYTDKINAAFSLYGPSGYLATIENLTDLRMDHLAIMDWKGFKALTEAFGGVEVCIPESFYDSSQDVTWEEGCQTLEGEPALQYVRTRHGLENGDFDRIARQQNFLRGLMAKILEDTDSKSGVGGITSALGAITENLTVDADWSTDEIRELGLSLRGLGADDVSFLTAPMAGYDTTDDGQSIVRLDEEQNRDLWRSVKRDRVPRYIARYGDDAGQLAAPGDVA